MAVGDSVSNPNIVENVASRLVPGDQMILRGSAPILWEDDFIASELDAYVTITHPNGKWLVLAAGDGTCVTTVNTVNGIVTGTLTNAAETQDALIYGANNRCFELGKCIFTARVKVSVYPTYATSAAMFVCGLTNVATGANAVDSATANTWFAMRGVNGAATNGLVYAESKNGVDTTRAVTTTLTPTTSEWVWYTIDTTDIASIKYYINGVRVCTDTTFAQTQVVDPLVQPIIGLRKLTASTALGTCLIDYVAIYQNRA